MNVLSDLAFWVINFMFGALQWGILVVGIWLIFRDEEPQETVPAGEPSAYWDWMMEDDDWYADSDQAEAEAFADEENWWSRGWPRSNYAPAPWAPPVPQLQVSQAAPKAPGLAPVVVRRVEGRATVTMATDLTMMTATGFVDGVVKAAGPDEHIIYVERGRCLIVSEIGRLFRERGYQTHWCRFGRFEGTGWIVTPS